MNSAFVPCQKDTREYRIYESCYMMNFNGKNNVYTNSNHLTDNLLPTRPEPQSTQILSDPVNEIHDLTFDSECTEHMVNSCSHLTNYLSFRENDSQ